MSDRKSTAGWQFSALVLLCACTASTGAFAQSCYNNSNTNLVRNGGFEEGFGTNISHWNVRWTGTLTNGSAVDPYVTIGNDNPYAGKQELDLGTTGGANDISQPIKNTVAGDIYTVCFWLYSAPNVAVGKTSFQVLWNDVTELELTQSAQSPYQYYTFTVAGTGQDHLRFRERNDQGYYYLDDVAVQLCSGCNTGSHFGKK